MSDVSSPARSVAPRTKTVAHFLAAFAVGSVVFSVAFAVGQGVPAPYSVSFGGEIVDLAPELILLVAVGFALVRSLRRFAWLIAAAGLAGVAALFFQGATLERDQLFALLAVFAGLQLAGVLLALAEADRSARWAIAIGLGAGAIAGRFGLALVIRAAKETLFSDSLHGDDAIVALLGLLTAVAGLVLLLGPGAASKVAEPKPWGPVVWVLAAAVAAVALSWLWQLVLEEITRSSTGGISESRAEFVESMDVLARITIGVMVGIILLVAAYRRGGANLARWVVVAFGVAATSVALPTIVASAETEAELLLRFVIPAVVGAVAGSAAVRFVDRSFPWDALGIVLGAAGVLFTTNRGLIELPDLTEPAIVLGTFGLALGLAAGLARLTDPSARGLSAAEVSMSAGFGVAALLLSQQVISPVPYLVRQDLRGPQLAVPLTMLGAAVVLVVLFGLGRLVQRIRRDLHSDAATSQG